MPPFLRFDIMATQHSPEAFLQFCHNTRFEGCTVAQTALLLSLAQCTGWSADYIGLKMQEVLQTETRFTAESIWNFHWNWTILRGGTTSLTAHDVATMKLLLRDAGVELEPEEQRPLYQTEIPVTIAFDQAWNPDVRSIHISLLFFILGLVNYIFDFPI